ncbi:MULTISPECIES: hypothetical protein [Thermobacillus]|uniref:hypothetical protein n=1 Tax=Thermobacillus TaxID=76632 RepID=UPI0012F8A629|nr:MULTISPECIES: hypothetical protein [Thermobacillus]
MSLDEAVKTIMMESCPKKKDCCLGYSLECELDKMAVYEIVVGLEEIMDIKLDAEKITENNFANFDTIIKLVRSQLNETQQIPRNNLDMD